jgi:succinoglycan biosynthesis protein ExoM
MLISICICTFRRTSVIDTLNSIARLNLPRDVELEIVVVDNDADGYAGAAVRQWAAGATIPVTYAIEPRRNIAHARNRVMELALGERIALIDDDEVADPDWLKALLAAAQTYRADVVTGRVIALYPSDAPRWIVAADPLSRNWGPSGMFVTTGSTANVLLDKAVITSRDIRFDPAFGLSGGEDTDFFSRLHAAGARIVIENAAVVRERVGLNRLDAAYLRLRAMRSGQSYALIRLRSLDRTERLRFLAFVALKFVSFSLAASVTRAVARPHALKFAIRGWLNFGKLRACAGYPLPEVY